MTEKEQGLEFPINQELLEEAARAVEEWKIIKGRLVKIDEHKNQVSKVVYERVHADYFARLSNATESALEKKRAVDHEVIALKETRKKIGSQLDEHRHKLDEVNFRNKLGEFTDEEYQAASRTEQDKITKFETILNAVEGNISRYENIFAGEAELLGSEKDPFAVDTSDLPKVGAQAVAGRSTEPATDANGFVIDMEASPDYFSAPTDADKTNPEMEESATAKEPSGGSLAEALKKARVVIINGDDAGKAFPVKGIVSFGRAESNTVVLKDAKISRQHAQIQQQGSEYVLIDLSSSNGTYVNGQRVEEHVLSNGDEIMMGDFILQFQC